jgi:hypothetical protein
MGTRSAIGILNDDGTVRGVYCHWDGYTEHNGVILQEFYTDRQKILSLLDCGDMSSLGADIGEKHNFDDTVDSFACKNTHVHKWCTFYGRDRNEFDIGATECKNISHFLKKFSDSHCEYFYLFTQDNRWIVADEPDTKAFLYVQECLDKNIEV